MRAFWIRLIMMTVLALPLGSVWAEPITTVNVLIEGTNYSLAPTLSKRMAAGIETVGRRVLVGRDTQEVTQLKGQFEALTSDIASRVLYGYDIDSLTITPGSTSTIHVRVHPYGKVIKNISVVYDYGNISPMGRALLEKKVEQIAPQVEQLLLGAPLDSLDWVSSVAQSILKERMELIIPSFATQVAINPGETTEVRIYLIPQGDIIRSIHTDVESDTLPRFLFYSLKQSSTDYLKDLQGLPVRFVAAEAPLIEKVINERLQKSKASTTYGVQLTPHLEVASNTLLVVKAKTNRYVVRGEGRVDMGKVDDTLSLMAHVGYNVTPRHEVFVETVFYPGSYKWKWYPSYLMHLGKHGEIAYQYDVHEKEHILWLKEDIGPRLALKVSRNLTDKENEYSLLYDLEKYVTLQFIAQKDKKFVRVIGHI